MVLKTKHAIAIFQKVGIWAFIVVLMTVLFERPLKVLLLEPALEFLRERVDLTFNVVFYIFLACGALLFGIVYWLHWSEKKLQSKITAYLSRLVCPDYYRDMHRLKVDAVVGDAMMRYRAKELEPEADFKHDGTSAADRQYAGTDGPEREEIFSEGGYDIRKRYYANGRLKQEASFRDGKLDGVSRTYYEDGRLHHEKTYRGGQMNGIYRAYDEDGGLFFEIEYRDNRQHGRDRIYASGGILQFEDTYVEGRRVNRKTFDAQGNLKFNQDF